MSDNVNHPSHYTKGGIECIEAIKASMSPEGFQDYCKGNVMKYIWRWRDKTGVEDLKKASRCNGKSLKLEYQKVDISSVPDRFRGYYLHLLADNLQVCASRNSCSECKRVLKIL